MPTIDPVYVLAALPIISTAVLGYLQYRTNAKLAQVQQNREPSQSAADDNAALHNAAEANAIMSKSLAEEQERRHRLEVRVSELEKLNKRDKVRMVIDLYLGETVRIENATVERIQTGPLDPRKAPAS